MIRMDGSLILVPQVHKGKNVMIENDNRNKNNYYHNKERNGKDKGSKRRSNYNMINKLNSYL